MSIRAWPLWAALALTAVLAGKVAMVWPQLPPMIATHFDAVGRPNGWSSPMGLLLALGLPIALLALGALAVGRIDRFPDRLVNLPNKSYWLASERRARSFDFLVAWIRWFLVLSLGLVTWIMTAALDANLTTDPRLDVPGWLLPGFSLVVAAMLGGLFWRFGKTR